MRLPDKEWYACERERRHTVRGVERENDSRVKETTSMRERADTSSERDTKRERGTVSQRTSMRERDIE